MRLKFVRDLAVLALMNAAVATHAWGQATVVFSPETLTFNLATQPSSQPLTISLSSGQGTFAIYALSTGLSITTPDATTCQVNTGASQLTVPCTYNISVDRAALCNETTGTITISGQGITSRTLTVNYTGTGGCGGGGSGTFYTNIPTPIQFTTTDTVRSIPLFSSTGAIPSYTPTVIYGNFAYQNWLSTNPGLNQVTSSTTINALVNTSGLPAGTYSATLYLNPNQTGYSTLTIPVNLTVGGGSNSVFTANPSSVNFTYSAGTTQQLSQTVAVSAPSQTNFNVSLSSTLVGLVSVSPTSGTTNTNLVVTLPFPNSIVSAISGTITLTPTSGSNLNPYVLPVTINPGTGGGVGSGTLQVSPGQLAFTAVAGGPSAPGQELRVTSTDPAGQIIQVQVTSTNSFLQIESFSSVFTPSIVRLTASPSNLSPGTYNGQVLVTPTSGFNTTPVSIPVTFRVLPNITVTPNPTSVTLTGRTGQTTGVTQDVAINITGGSAADVPYTFTPTTTSGGQWLSTTPATGTGIPSTVTISANAQGLSIGSYTGQVVLATGGTPLATIPVTLNVIASGTLAVTPSTLSFSHRTTNTAPPATQTIQVTSTAEGPALNWNTAATTNSGGNWLQSTASGTTPGSIVVTVIPTGLQPGTYTGRVRITSPGASNSPQDVTVMLSVTNPPVPQVFNFQNSGSYTVAHASPGLIFTIRGMDLGPTPGATASVTNNMFPTTLGGTRVLFDDTAAPLLYSSANQVNGVVPFNVAGRSSVTLRVERDGIMSASRTLEVRATAPGLYTLDGSGTGQVAALNQDGTVNSPGNPAQAGSIVVLFGTGLGTANPALTTGGIVGTTPPFPRFSSLVEVRVGGVPAEIVYAGPAPGFVGGAAQFNIRIPAGTAPGSAYVQVEAGGIGSENLTTISVR